ncbi:hypothetical protein IMSAGC016_01585 [Muribaculaceae bacterium]|nr:hypothetical protein IMSAGC016_01585 [Muribaculaceae bacterium]
MFSRLPVHVTVSAFTLGAYIAEVRIPLPYFREYLSPLPLEGYPFYRLTKERI